MSFAYIGLGSNLGNRESYLHKSLDLLKQHNLSVCAVSSFIETKPWGLTAQPDFLNAAACLQTTLRPQPLLQVLLSVESQLGRVRQQHWGPRSIDLDLLLYDSECLHTSRLILPHPEIARREFVLKPLAEIAPNVWHPTEKKTIQQLWEKLLVNKE